MNGGKREKEKWSLPGGKAIRLAEVTVLRTFLPMEKPLIVQNEIILHAPIMEVWDALVNPEKTKIYMYGCEAISDWSPGSLLFWKGQYEGKEMVFVKGHVVTCTPPVLLHYTVFDPNSSMEDIPANYLHVIYTLEALNGTTRFNVVQKGFETAARGEERYKEVANNGEGWNPILKAIAEMLESQ